MSHNTGPEKKQKYSILTITSCKYQWNSFSSQQNSSYSRIHFVDYCRL